MSFSQFYMRYVSLYVQFSKRIYVMSSKTSLSMDVQELILGITYKDGETVDKKNKVKMEVMKLKWLTFRKKKH